MWPSSHFVDSERAAHGPVLHASFDGVMRVLLARRELVLVDSNVGPSRAPVGRLPWSEEPPHANEIRAPFMCGRRGAGVAIEPCRDVVWGASSFRSGGSTSV